MLIQKKNKVEKDLTNYDILNIIDDAFFVRSPQA